MELPDFRTKAWMFFKSFSLVCAIVEVTAVSIKEEYLIVDRVGVAYIG